MFPFKWFPACCRSDVHSAPTGSAEALISVRVSLILTHGCTKFLLLVRVSLPSGRVASIRLWTLLSPSQTPSPAVQMGHFSASPSPTRPPLSHRGAPWDDTGKSGRRVWRNIDNVHTLLRFLAACRPSGCVRLIDAVKERKTIFWVTCWRERGGGEKSMCEITKPGFSPHADWIGQHWSSVGWRSNVNLDSLMLLTRIADQLDQLD